MKKIKLGEVLDVKRGQSLSGEHYSITGDYLRLTLGNFNYPGGGFKLNTSKEDLFFTGKIKPEYIMNKGDIITPLTEQVRGLLGTTATIPEDNLFIQSGDIGLIIPDETKIDKRFAYYLVSSPIVKKQLDAGSQQTKIRHTSPKKIKDCIAVIPENINIQRSIAHILDSINLKIEMNNKIVSEIEKITKAIYNYWFLQFDFPNIIGKAYKTLNGEMVYNEELKRKIPANWKVATMNHSEITKIIKPGIDYFSKKNYLATANVDNISIVDGEWINYEERESRANMQPVENSVWFAKMKNTVKHVTVTSDDKWIIDKYIFSTGFLGLKTKPYALSYIHCFINSDIFEFVKNRLAHGATQEAVNNNDLKYFKVVIPPKNVLEEFNSIILPMIKTMNTSMHENLELEKLRNYLFPMLINGQVSVQ